ncbi:hypothetical protein ONZ43_g9 [Nemania bipapillata]|uniref:Uncharacterized protein n=1 Tax=Nemania bipapillata TaxID=110536 RepID=A0ACC2JA05_9PEZI|nr:hypothetical protein ONZ43_g9 [Nemania bipapillata]
MPSFVPDAAIIHEAEELVFRLKSHAGSHADQIGVVRQLDKIRCLLHQGPDALMFQSYPFQLLPALNVLLEFGVFDAVPIRGGVSVQDIASAVKLDRSILSRFLRIALTQGIFTEQTPDVYKHTPASAIFREDQAASFYRLGTTQFPNWWKVCDYLKCHSAQDAQDATKVPYSWASGKEGSTYYEVMEEDAVVSNAWHKGMMAIEATQPVTSMFPFRSMQTAIEVEPQRAFIVDVGGGRGNALVSIMRECGGSYGAGMILQDMAQVLAGEDVVSIDGVQNMVHDFFNPQPVKNAHIYYLRNVLHNYYDERSRTILCHIVDAMGPTSRVLIGEMILPTTAAAGSDPFPFFMDLNMFMEGGVERTEEHWVKLLSESTIEAKLRV